MFYNTGIATYVWVLSNKKATERKGKVQLINGVNLCGKMRKSLGSKRNIMSDDDIKTITRSFGAFEVVEPQVLDTSLLNKRATVVVRLLTQKSKHPKPSPAKSLTTTNSATVVLL